MGKKDQATSIVRAPLPVRARMRTWERIAPQRAARLAEQMWFTVPKPPTPSKLQRFTVTGGAPFYVMSGESEVSGVAFGPENGPVALLVHGWGGYWQQLSAHIPALVESGYRVIAYDAPSHGRSTHGAEGFGSGSVLEMTDAVNAVIGLCGQPQLVVAHSLGAIAVLRALRGRHPADGYVFLAPQVRLEPAIEWFEQVSGMGPRTRQLFMDRLHQRVGLDLGDFDATDDVRALVADGQAPELLVVHDTDDPDVPVGEAEALVKLWPGADLMTTSGLGHRQVIWHDEVKKRVAAFAHHLAGGEQVVSLQA